MSARRNAARRAGARIAGRTRLARGGQGGAFCDLGHRTAGRTGLPHRLQSLASTRMERLMMRAGDVSLNQWRDIWRGGAVALDPESAARIEQSAAAVQRIVARGEPVYGVNTGFGKLSSVRIDAADLMKLQRNIVLSHAVGVGEPASLQATRLMMALKLASLAQGASGVRGATIA